MHSVQGAAARRQAPRRVAPRGRVGDRLRRAGDRSRQAARLQEQRRQEEHERDRAARQDPQGALPAGPRRDRRRAQPAGDAGRRGRGAGPVRARHPRDRIDTGDSADAEGGRPARDGFDRGARSAGHPEIAARGRRRLHRPGARLGLRRSRQCGHGGRDDGGAAAWRRSRSRRCPRQARRADDEERAARDQSREGDAGSGGRSRHPRGQCRPERAGLRSRAGVGRPPAQLEDSWPREDARPGRSARLHHDRRAAADPRAVDLRDRRRRRRADAGARRRTRDASPSK